ncbi:MAG: acetyltransferase [bacterium]
MENEKGLVILGYGGHGRSLADVALASGFTTLVFLDDQAKPDETFFDFPVQREWVGPLPKGWTCVPGSGDNDKRKEQMDWIRDKGWPLGQVVSPTATLGIGSVLGPGCFIAHHAHVGPRSQVGEACVVNTSAVVDHDCVIGDYVHVSGHAGVAGYCGIGNFSLIGANAGVIDRVTIPARTVIGAGAMVLKSIEEPGVYIGIPAKRMR